MCIVPIKNCWICAVQSRSKGKWFLYRFWKVLMKHKMVVVFCFGIFLFFFFQKLFSLSYTTFRIRKTWSQREELTLWRRGTSTKDISEQWQQKEDVCEWHTIFTGYGNKYFCLQKPQMKEIRCSLDSSEGLSIVRATGNKQLRHHYHLHK